MKVPCSVIHQPKACAVKSFIIVLTTKSNCLLPVDHAMCSLIIGEPTQRGPLQACFTITSQGWGLILSWIAKIWSLGTGCLIKLIPPLSTVSSASPCFLLVTASPISVSTSLLLLWSPGRKLYLFFMMSSRRSFRFLIMELALERSCRDFHGLLRKQSTRWDSHLTQLMGMYYFFLKIEVWFYRYSFSGARVSIF